MKSNLYVAFIVIVAIVLIVKMVIGNQFVTYKDTENFVIKIQKNGTTTFRYYQDKLKKRLTEEEMEGLIDVIYENDFFTINDTLDTEWDGTPETSFFGTLTSITVKYDGESHTAQGGTKGSSLEYQRIENYILSLWEDEINELKSKGEHIEGDDLITEWLNTVMN